MDEDVVDTMTLCRAIGVTVHIRGTDADPKIVILDKRTQKMVGGIELKERIRRYHAVHK
jgi:hypothetical protein